MKQIIITISLLAIALVLIIGVVIPLLEHGAETGHQAVTRAQASITAIGRIIK